MITIALPSPQGRQYDVVYLKATGHQVILGTAGTGKTVMAIHRAMHLADPRTQNNGPTLLLTFNNSLATYIRHLASDYRSLITIETAAKFGRGYLNSHGLMPYAGIASPGLSRGLVAAAVRNIAEKDRASAFFEKPTDFFIDELEWINGMGVATLDEYLAIARRQNGTPSACSALCGVEYQIQLHCLSRKCRKTIRLVIPARGCSSGV